MQYFPMKIPSAIITSSVLWTEMAQWFSTRASAAKMLIMHSCFSGCFEFTFSAAASSSTNTFVCPSVRLSQPYWAYFVKDYLNSLPHHLLETPTACGSTSFEVSSGELKMLSFWISITGSCGSCQLLSSAIDQNYIKITFRFLKFNKNGTFPFHCSSSILFSQKQYIYIYTIHIHN